MLVESVPSADCSGDVQPYLSLALRLILSHSHRVRIATHPDFKDFVLEANKRLIDKKGKNGQKLEGLVEFFDIGGSPKELMSYMVKSESMWTVKESFALTYRSWTAASLGIPQERRCGSKAKDDGCHARRLLGVHICA